MRCLVTGAAGFIGSHLCERLLDDGHEVLGIDAFVPYYPRAVKERNLGFFQAHPRFTFSDFDLREPAPPSLLEGVEVVFHLAAVPGLVKSWSEYDLYEDCNLRATQKLLAAAIDCRSLRRFVFGSTSSVYGKYAAGDESLPCRPVSPYGVTKLAAEGLCQAYASAYDLPAVVLRYFSVYGPRQRPDMGYHRFIDAILKKQPISLYGDGRQVRGNTYVADCVAATVAAAEAPVGEVYNVGGGEAYSVREVIEKMERLIGRRARVVPKDERKGDQISTGADTRKIRTHLGWSPQTSFIEGLRAQIDWQTAQREALAA